MAISQEWWDRWWEEDWSWEGLAQKPWLGWVVLPDGSLVEDEESDRLENEDWQERFPKGARLATLQDYWRRAGCEDALHTMPGTDKQFTLMHLPPKWRDGSETLKADSDNPPEALTALLKAELGREIRETVFEGGRRLRGPDHRMQWDGGIIPRFALSELSIQPHTDNNQIPVSITARGAAFSGNADFESAAFSGDADFQSAAFSGNADFRSAAFSGDADFQSAAFSGDADFQSAAFSGDAHFASVAFSGYADFRNAIFLQNAFFSGKGNSVKSDGVKAEIKVRVSDKTIQDYEQPEALMWTAQRSFPSANFSGCIFMGAARFDNRDFHNAANFDGTKFYREAEFHGSQLHRAILFTQTDFDLALKPDERQWQAVPRRALERLHKAAMLSKPEDEQLSLEDWAEARFKEVRDKDNALKAPENDPDRSRYFEKVEEGFRTLKHAMEERRNRGQEARFFKLEFQARRMRRDEYVLWWERWLSKRYEQFSDFGTSADLPLLWLAILTVIVFPMLYLVMGVGFTHWPTGADFGDAMGYSFARIFPFGPWEEPKACSMIARMLAEVAQPDCPPIRGLTELYYRGGTPFWLRFYGSVQSLLAIILVFLSGLAIRRLFQIN